MQWALFFGRVIILMYKKSKTINAMIIVICTSEHQDFIVYKSRPINTMIIII